MNENIYNEEQMLKRGKSYKYAFISSIITNIFAFIFSDIIGIGYDVDAIYLINVGIPFTVCSISMIINNSYEGNINDSKKLDICALVGLSIALLIIYLPDIITGEEVLIENSIISESAGGLLISISILLIGIVYWVQKYIDKKNEVID